VKGTTSPAERPPELSSNGVTIPFDAAHFEAMADSTDLRGDPSALRDRFERDGYVRLRSVLEREQVLELRADYFDRFDDELLAPGTTARDGVFSGTMPAGLPTYGVAGHPAHAVVRGETFDRLTRDAGLAAVASSLLGGPARLLTRRILRHFHSASATASRAHVDFDYMDRGSDHAVTAWIPLGDCPIECGGITYLAGSHRVGRAALDRLRENTDRPDDRRPVSNDLALTAQALGGRWLWTDFRAGDVVLHSPHLVHASLDNRSALMRLSADIRFMTAGAEADPRWAGDWSADDGF
jgi:ectoine hydroxylase-related dioxygenase (phytanoyl-CoA dioxygenase family)